MLLKMYVVLLIAMYFTLSVAMYTYQTEKKIVGKT